MSTSANKFKRLTGLVVILIVLMTLFALPTYYSTKIVTASWGQTTPFSLKNYLDRASSLPLTIETRVNANPPPPCSDDLFPGKICKNLQVDLKSGETCATVIFNPEEVKLLRKHCKIGGRFELPDIFNFNCGVTPIVCDGPELKCSFTITVSGPSCFSPPPPPCLFLCDGTNSLLFIPSTGDYQFTRGKAGTLSSSTMVGRGSVTKTGCLTTLQDSRVNVAVNTCLALCHPASIKLAPLGPTLIIRNLKVTGCNRNRFGLPPNQCGLGIF